MSGPTDAALPLEIDVHAVKAMMENNQDFLLLDVRESFEYETCQIESSTLIPMSELGQRMDELDASKERLIVVHCHHGMRSLQVTHALRSAGFDKTQSMAGGIDQWSVEIDEAVPRY